MGKRKKPVERVCGNCKLYNPAKGECAVVILHEGRKYNLPVVAEDSCFFEGEHFDPISGSKDNFVEAIQEVKFWVENDKGEKTNGNGTVKLEYPDGFFPPGMDRLFG
jgi:hypothetical protein